MIWRPAKETLHRSVTHSCTGQPCDWMINSAGNAQNGKKSGIMQPCKSKTLSSNPDARWGSQVGLQWRQMVLWANILLLLRGSPLASVSTQLCSGPRFQRETKDKKKNERDSRKSEARRDRATNKPKCTVFKS